MTCVSAINAQLLLPNNFGQLPFDVDPSGGAQTQKTHWNEARPPRIAIIGAGAGGESVKRSSQIIIRAHPPFGI